MSIKYLMCQAHSEAQPATALLSSSGPKCIDCLSRGYDQMPDKKRPVKGRFTVVHGAKDTVCQGGKDSGRLHLSCGSRAVSHLGRSEDERWRLRPHSLWTQIPGSAMVLPTSRVSLPQETSLEIPRMEVCLLSESNLSQADGEA